jgi:hypothetical protein
MPLDRRNNESKHYIILKKQQSYHKQQKRLNFSMLPQHLEVCLYGLNMSIIWEVARVTLRTSERKWIPLCHLCDYQSFGRSNAASAVAILILFYYVTSSGYLSNILSAFNFIRVFRIYHSTGIDKYKR